MFVKTIKKKIKKKIADVNFNFDEQIEETPN